MPGIALALEDGNIRLSFEKDGQTTAVVMDSATAEALFRALGQMLTVVEGAPDEDDDEAGDEDMEFLDVTSPTIDIGLDDQGQAVVALQAGSLPAFMLRLKDEEARHIAQSLLEILNAPPDARNSQGGH
ncbi:MAG TPA: hypothetical protein VM434_15470 [Beijerinckiaceae bacterium]|nr:hypothetical protein [Beijerinckiaceae bacterium]